METLAKIIKVKFSSYVPACPENMPLFDALKKTPMHDEACPLKSYQKAPKQKQEAATQTNYKSISVDVAIKPLGSYCSYCLNERKELKVCSRCRQAFYCDTGCQKAHYPTHKAICLHHSQHVQIANELKTLSSEFKPQPKTGNK